MKHGHGIFYWKNGNIFEGDFSKNKITNGKLKYANEDWCEVDFSNGQQTKGATFYSASKDEMRF
jgi:hypothetical protein